MHNMSVSANKVDIYYTIKNSSFKNLKHHNFVKISQSGNPDSFFNVSVHLSTKYIPNHEDKTDTYNTTKYDSVTPSP